MAERKRKATVGQPLQRRPSASASPDRYPKVIWGTPRNPPICPASILIQGYNNFETGKTDHTTPDHAFGVILIRKLGL